ncbi:hypothetical protein, partial [Ralstonia pseudosolanacearum]|uniref:hypothetical protein n=1 Tax=Ralstonia pseudosolanacearum TaxID=1310165 RepID=UPI003CEEDFDF
MACVDIASEAVDLHRILPRSIAERPRNATRKSSSAADVSGRIDIAQRAGIPDVESDQPSKDATRMHRSPSCKSNRYPPSDSS